MIKSWCGPQSSPAQSSDWSSLEKACRWGSALYLIPHANLVQLGIAVLGWTVAKCPGDRAVYHRRLALPHHMCSGVRADTGWSAPMKALEDDWTAMGPKGFLGRACQLLALMGLSLTSSATVSAVSEENFGCLFVLEGLRSGLALYGTCDLARSPASAVSPLLQGCLGKSETGPSFATTIVACFAPGGALRRETWADPAAVPAVASGGAFTVLAGLGGSGGFLFGGMEELSPESGVARSGGELGVPTDFGSGKELAFPCSSKVACVWPAFETGGGREGLSSRDSRGCSCSGVLSTETAWCSPAVAVASTWSLESKRTFGVVGSYGLIPLGSPLEIGCYKVRAFFGGSSAVAKESALAGANESGRDEVVAATVGPLGGGRSTAEPGIALQLRSAASSMWPSSFLLLCSTATLSSFDSESRSSSWISAPGFTAIDCEYRAFHGSSQTASDAS